MKINKFILLIILIQWSVVAIGQNKIYSLKECIDLAIENKSSIMAMKAAMEIDSANSTQILAKNKFQVSLAYDYLFNPIVRTNIVPVGKFNPVPTDEVRPIKFGTNFQQGLGVQVLKPIYDATIKGRLTENNLQLRLREAEVNRANEELIYEVASSFVKILLKEKQLEQAAYDTIRTAATRSNARTLKEDGKVLQIEVNRAQINHNNSVFAYQSIISELVKEKIYLGFLTNLLEEPFDIADKENLITLTNLDVVGRDVVKKAFPEIQEKDAKIALIKQQILNEKLKYKPTVTANGYLATEQYSNSINPFASNSWFGNSFVGVSVRLPLLLAEDRLTKTAQYKSQIKAYDFEKNEIEKIASRNRATALQEIDFLKEESKLYEANANMYKQNLEFLNTRLEAGQETTHNITMEEIEYQKEQKKLKDVQDKTWLHWLMYLKYSGLMHVLYK